jgi:hypothetical protein
VPISPFDLGDLAVTALEIVDELIRGFILVDRRTAQRLARATILNLDGLDRSVTGAGQLNGCGKNDIPCGGRHHAHDED